MLEDKYRWETIIEMLNNCSSYFIIGDKRKRNKMVSKVENDFNSKVIHLNCKSDILNQIYDAISSDLDKTILEEKNEFYKSFPSLGIEKYLKTCNKQVLFVVEDVIPNDYMSTYSYEYQIWRHNKFNIYTIMCGSRCNIKKLLNTNTPFYSAYRIFTNEEIYNKMYLRKKKYA